MAYTQTQARDYETGLTQTHTSKIIPGSPKHECIDLMRRVRDRGNASDITIIEGGFAYTEDTVSGPCRVSVTYEKA